MGRIRDKNRKCDERLLMYNILVDSCFWYALFDERDEHHALAQKMENYLEFGNIILPFPILYETLNTRFAKRENWMSGLNEYMSRETTILVPDTEYRKKALSGTFFNALTPRGKRPMALVDMSIRLMLEDIKLDITALITFNEDDFTDICHSKRIELISE